MFDVDTVYHTLFFYLPFCCSVSAALYCYYLLALSPAFCINQLSVECLIDWCKKQEKAPIGSNNRERRKFVLLQYQWFDIVCGFCLFAAKLVRLDGIYAQKICAKCAFIIDPLNHTWHVYKDSMEPYHSSQSTSSAIACRSMSNCFLGSRCFPCSSKRSSTCWLLIVPAPGSFCALHTQYVFRIVGFFLLFLSKVWQHHQPSFSVSCLEIWPAKFPLVIDITPPILNYDSL